MPNRTILVTGGAGYIGSHFVNFLKEKAGYKILVVDNFSQGRENVLKHPSIEYLGIDLRDAKELTKVFSSNKIDAVVHFAAKATITASVSGPEPTYDNNVVGGYNLLHAMLEAGVKKIIFSSSGSVYGEPQSERLKEDHPKNPINPYGFSKLAFERMLEDYHEPYAIDYIAFRYFNPAGCVESLEIGEYHKPETHVIPCIMQTLLGQRKEFFVYGNKFDTPDGTGVRDYIHVEDLVEAHWLGLAKLFESPGLKEAYNLGTNKGSSVMDLIKAAEEATGLRLNYKIAPARAGDPSSHIADASKAMKELNWQPKRSLREMMQSAYESFKSRSAS